MPDHTSILPTPRGWKVVLNVDGVDVSGLSIVDKRIRVGMAGLKMAGIAGVWTGEDHRRKGYATRVTWSAIKEMERRRYDVSILFGIEDFYHRYGYSVCSANSVCQVATDSLPASAPTGFRVRAARPGDLPGIVALYRRTNATRSVSAIRSGQWKPVHGHLPGWRMPRMAEDVERRPGKAIVVENRRGATIAYASYDSQVGHCMVTEVGATDRSAYPVIARRIRRLAREAGAQRVRFCLPADDPFGEYLGRFGCGWSIHFPENSGSMGRLVDLRALMLKLLPTLGNRLSLSELRLPKGGITFDTDIGSVTLTSSKSEIIATDNRSRKTVSISQMQFSQLMFGHRSVEDLLIDGEIRLAKNLIQVVSTLFPKSHPYMWWGDRF
jgi:predicted acetyltransferase